MWRHGVRQLARSLLRHFFDMTENELVLIDTVPSGNDGALEEAELGGLNLADEQDEIEPAA